MNVAELMNESVITVSSDKSLAYVAERMNELRVGSFLVVDHEKTMGIITSLDVRSSHPNRIVADAMTAKLITVPKTCFIWDAVKMMDKHQIERLIVMDGNAVCGILTREIAKSAISQLVDPLTGLYRQAYVHTIGENFLKNQQPFQVLFIDLNRFGEINKKFGHPVGDDFLVKYAQKLKGLAKKNDFMCRYAGDEFLIITLRDENETLFLAEQLSDTMKIHEVPISASVGVFFGTKEPDLFSISFREIITRASLLSTQIKTQRSSVS